MKENNSSSLGEVFNSFDLDFALRDSVYSGVGLVKGIINPEFLEILNLEVAAGPYSQASAGNELVSQKFDSFAFMYEPVGMPLLRKFQQATEQLIRSHSNLFKPLADWRAIDTVIQRYGADGFLSAHRDLVRNPYIVPSFTIAGSCQFDILESREGPFRKTIFPEAGDLLLLLAPGLVENPSIADRPFHQLTGPLDPNIARVAVTFRHNLNPEKPIEGFKYVNS